MYTITKSFKFCYAHRLVGNAGKCWRLHGHTAAVDILVRSEKLNKHGMVVNFETIGEGMGEWIARELDHRTILYKGDPLAEVLVKEGECLLLDRNPTAENLARLIFDAAKKEGFDVYKVRFWESDSTVAEYSQERSPGDPSVADATSG